MTERTVVWISILCIVFSACPAWGAPAKSGAPVYVSAGRGVSSRELNRIERIVAGVRPVRPHRGLPNVRSQSSRTVATGHRTSAVRLALQRATEAEGRAEFDACVREAANALDDASSLIERTGSPELLRTLHLQIGSCMVLGPNPANARPHLLSALLLDETLPPKGRYREEVEVALGSAQTEISGRTRGKVLISSDPPGAEVWIDGRKQRGRTPVDAEVRLGDHFVTLRRFRFEPRTERVQLVPSSRIEFALEPAGKAELREQLAALTRPKARMPADKELVLARAVWSGGDQVLVAERTQGAALSLSLLDATSGRKLRAGTVKDGFDEDELTRGVCRTLGTSCEPRGGVPWYVWPIAGVALVGGITAAFLVADKERDVRFCPPSGCR